MSDTLPILALVFYPLLFSLPLNPIRYRWGFQHGFAPMPADVQIRAEAADRRVLFGSHLTLIAVVAFLMHRSTISVDGFGFTTSSWKSAIALGALLSFIPMGMGAFLPKIISSEKLSEEQELHGPLATWCGLSALSSFSHEFWRAFCIAALIRLAVPGWIAVLIASVAYGAARLYTSTATAAGAAVFGGLAGFLFVKTGSLLAPLTMALFAAIAHLYRVRYTLSRAASDVAPLKCPACSRNIRGARIPYGTYFPCPDCGESLTLTLDFDLQVGLGGLVLALLTLFFLNLSFEWFLVLILPFWILFAGLCAGVVATFLPGFLSVEVHHDPQDPKKGKLFRL
jgi:hypothetical protein